MLTIYRDRPEMRRVLLERGATVGLMVGIVAALAMITEMVFEMRVASFMMISSGYPLIGSILMGIVLGVWKPKATTAEAEVSK